MLRWLVGPLPIWMQRTNPLLRVAYQRYRPNATLRGRLVRIIFSVVCLSMLVLVGYFFAALGSPRPLSTEHFVDALFRILYYPACGVQVVLWGIAFSLGVGTLNAERRHQTWDALRATEYGAEMTLRTRWVAIFYRVRHLIYILLVVRLLLIAGVLYQVMAFRGIYLDLLTANITPEVSLVWGVILLAILLTAALLLPLVMLGLAITLGLWVAVMLRQRAYASIVQIIMLGGYIGLNGALFYAFMQLNTGSSQMTQGAAFMVSLAYATFSDWGLSLMNLNHAAQMWLTIPYSVLMGIVLLGIVLLLAGLIDGVLRIAIHRAQITE
ncbi:hypothetical protein G4Y79_19050 [Phototrophicus methaneseepsis]|uniref:Uncharacterized protein n=1 Tax=Phototrophicus methaneseepsis TaxID=2710758 RepID=A0A7S8E7I6_9CHLR|nr:hypothetical protein [Phototrophicus methaneseepsis]QPC81767.1 hypothetical protein G4Y79_19050 [Phototrophicus methaneseepsis]